MIKPHCEDIGFKHCWEERSAYDVDAPTGTPPRHVRCCLNCEKWERLHEESEVVRWVQAQPGNGQCAKVGFVHVFGPLYIDNEGGRYCEPGTRYCQNCGCTENIEVVKRGVHEWREVEA